MLEGIDKLSKALKEAEEFASALDGTLAELSFDPEDPASIEAAIQTLHDRVDEKASRYRGNEFVEQIAGGLKEEGRNAILERAAEARLSEGND